MCLTKISEFCFYLFLFNGILLTTLSQDHTNQKENNHTSIKAEWQASPHALSMDSDYDETHMNDPECAHCHTKEGFLEVKLEEKISTAPYNNPEGITCSACHLIDEGESFNKNLRVNDIKNACICHDELVNNKDHLLEWCPQYDVLDGKGAIELGGEYKNGKHTILEKKCISCHMEEVSDNSLHGIVGEHTFRVITKGKTPRILNLKACTKCHEDMSIEKVDKYQSHIKNRLVTLSSLLPQKPDSKDSTKTEPKYPADPSLTTLERKVSTNYWYIVKDGTNGIHNPPYISKLLEESIKVLENKKGSSK